MSDSIQEICDAIRNNRTEIVRSMLEKDRGLANVIDPGSDRPVLHQSLFNGDFDTVKLLLEHGASVESDDGTSPLMYAVKPEITGLTQLLLKYGADPKFEDSYDGTVLHLAASWGNIESVRLLVEAGVSPDAVNGKGETPLFQAMQAGEKECIKYLSQFSASGVHQYLLVSLAPQWKAWGVRMAQFREFTSSVCSFNQGGRGKGWRHATGKLTSSPGCMKAHWELRKITLSSNSLEEFQTKLFDWANAWLKNGTDDLPRLLQP